MFCPIVIGDLWTVNHLDLYNNNYFFNSRKVKTLWEHTPLRIGAKGDMFLLVFLLFNLIITAIYGVII